MKRLKILGIIGDPIRHSLSPRMQNAALRKSNLPYVYLPFHVRPKDLKFFLKNADTLGLSGFNVTIPHKKAVIRHLDWISPEAKAIGAVNTVVIRRGKLRGYNTDASGYLRSLQIEAKFHPKKKTVFILGAGGAARAIVYGLAKSGAKQIILANRTSSRARTLARNLQKKFPRVSFRTIPLSPENLKKHFPEVDLLINTTSIGLKGTRWKSLPLRSLPKKSIVSDLVYSPLLTPLLNEGRRLSLKIHPGLGMLVHQGVASFTLWTGKKPDLVIMKKALVDALK